AGAVAALDDRNMDIKSGNERLERTDVMGATPNYTDVRNIGIAQGRMITQSDDDHRAEVAFIGADVANKLFPTVDPIGKTFRRGTQRIAGARSGHPDRQRVRPIAGQLRDHADPYLPEGIPPPERLGGHFHSGSERGIDAGEQGRGADADARPASFAV